MPTYDDNLKTAQGLEKIRDAMKSIFGDEWEEIIAEQSPIIEQIMTRDGHNNPLKAVLPAAKQMRADGQDPLLILAVATEMCIRKPKESNLNNPIA